MPLRTMARMTALSPGQSPPPVSIPIRMLGLLFDLRMIARSCADGGRRCRAKHLLKMLAGIEWRRLCRILDCGERRMGGWIHAWRAAGLPMVLSGKDFE